MPLPKLGVSHIIHLVNPAVLIHCCFCEEPPSMGGCSLQLVALHRFSSEGLGTKYVIPLVNILLAEHSCNFYGCILSIYMRTDL